MSKYSLIFWRLRMLYPRGEAIIRLSAKAALVFLATYALHASAEVASPVNRLSDGLAQNTASKEDLPARNSAKLQQAPNDGRTAVRVELKGLYIGMQFREAFEMIITADRARPAHKRGCDFGSLSPASQYYIYGDRLILCKNSYSYYGNDTSSAIFAFVDDKLKYVMVERFAPKGTWTGDIPEVVGVLAETRYGKAPKISRRPIKGDSLELKFEWVDDNGDILSYTTDRIYKSAGFSNESAIVELKSSDFNEYSDRRKAAVSGEANEKARAAEAKRNSNM